MVGKKTPKNNIEWESWCLDKLGFIKPHLSDESTFLRFCNKLRPELDILQQHYDEEDRLKEKIDRQKEVGRDLATLLKSLEKAREKGLFKDLAPDFFMSLLIQCCETEYCKLYKKGTHNANANRQRAVFTAKTANLLEKFTGKPFRYNVKGDPLCRVVFECLERIGHKVSETAVRDVINNYISIRASTPPGEFPTASTSFNHDYLKKHKLKTDNLPNGYIYKEAIAQYKQQETVTKNKKNFRHSFIIGDFLLGKLQGRPEEMVHPNLRPWMDYMMFKAIEVRDKRAHLIAEWFSDLKEVPEKISRNSACCRWLICKFRKLGNNYSEDDVLEIIRTSICIVVKDESHETVQYENCALGILKIPCSTSSVVSIEPIVIHPIPITCPPDLIPS